jgi:hypothetical protein
MHQVDETSLLKSGPGRNFYYLGEWALYNCHPVDDTSFWQFVGDNIWVDVRFATSQHDYCTQHQEPL